MYICTRVSFLHPHFSSNFFVWSKQSIYFGMLSLPFLNFFHLHNLHFFSCASPAIICYTGTLEFILFYLAFYCPFSHLFPVLYSLFVLKLFLNILSLVLRMFTNLYLLLQNIKWNLKFKWSHGKCECGNLVSTVLISFILRDPSVHPYVWYGYMVLCLRG